MRLRWIVYKRTNSFPGFVETVEYPFAYQKCPWVITNECYLFIKKDLAVQRP